MALTLYFHPLSSYCHKVLIALYETDTPFQPQIVDLGNPDSAAALRRQWPFGKIPVLHDSARNVSVAETSIIIEYLQQYYPGEARLLPRDQEECLQARLWDRIFDLYVSTPMQKFTLDWFRPAESKDTLGIADARRTLDCAYAMIDQQLAGVGPWAIGSAFSMADCAATPALFYASIVHPIPERYGHLLQYFERLLQRPSVGRTLTEAQPYFGMYPFHDAMPQRLREIHSS